MEEPNNQIVPVNEQNKVRNLATFRGRKNKSLRTLETLVDVDRQIEKFRSDKLELIRGEDIYSKGMFSLPQKIVEHYDEVPVNCTNDREQIEMKLVTKKMAGVLKERAYGLVHLGLINIVVKGMHRKGLGTRALVALVDDSHKEMGKKIIGMMEIDMNEGGGFTYFTPDFILTLDDFVKYIKVVIKTKGYIMNNDRDNLMICKSFIGRVSNSSTIRYSLITNNVTEILASKGIRALPGVTYSNDHLEGTDWKLDSSNKELMSVPTERKIFEHEDNSITVRFSNYEVEAPNDIESEDEELEKIDKTVINE